MLDSPPSAPEAGLRLGTGREMKRLAVLFGICLDRLRRVGERTVRRHTASDPRHCVPEEQQSVWTKWAL